MSFELYRLDVFTTVPFGGNPLAVCLLEYDDDINDEIKRKIVAELNQPMVAFVSRQWTRNISESNDRTDKIRYFTVTDEITVCGHASVGSALVLYKTQSQRDESVDTIREFSLETKSGKKLLANIDENDCITISLPILLSKSIELNDKWTQSLIKTFNQNFDTNLVEEVWASNRFLMVRFRDSDENKLLELKPDFEALNKLKRELEGIIVTQKADFNRDKVHFYSRVFLPWVGVNEDLVCGAAHTQMTPFWSQRLGITDKILIGKQCSQRPGIVRCRLNGDQVEVSGNAVIVSKGYCIL